jgi:predicted nucleic acid-binding protein
MKLLIDTNRYTDLMNGAADVRQVLEAADSIAIPFVTLAELRAGFALGTRGPENERILTSFLQQDGVLVLFPDDRTTHAYAAVYVAGVAGRSRRTISGLRPWRFSTV